MENPSIPARISIKTLAWLTLFWNNRGELPSTRSRLISKSLDAFVNIASYQNPGIKPAAELSYEDSVQILTSCGLGIPEQKAARVSIMRQLQDEALREDFSESLPKEVVRKHISRGKPTDKPTTTEQSKKETRDDFDMKRFEEKEASKVEALKAAYSNKKEEKDADRSGQDQVKEATRGVPPASRQSPNSHDNG